MWESFNSIVNAGRMLESSDASVCEVREGITAMFGGRDELILEVK